MKKLLVLLTLAICVFGFVFADPLEGYWLSIDEKTGETTGAWQIYIEGNELRGKLVKNLKGPDTALASDCKPSYKGFPIAGEVNKLPLIGTPFIWGLSKVSEGAWAKGNIIDPSEGKMYGCEITFHATDGKKYKENTLEMRGKIGPLGRSQYWKSTTMADIEKLPRKN